MKMSRNLFARKTIRSLTNIYNHSLIPRSHNWNIGKLSVSHVSSTTIAFSGGKLESESVVPDNSDNFFQKYFPAPMEFDSDLMAQQLSINVLSPMILDALEKNDFKTLKMLVQQANQLKEKGQPIVAQVLEHYLLKDQLHECKQLLEVLSPKSFKLPLELCQHLLTKSIEYSNWDIAFIVIANMIETNLPIHPRYVFFTFSGLMSNREHGIPRVIDLCKLLLVRQKFDLIEKIEFHRLSNFAKGFGYFGMFNEERTSLLLLELKDAWLEQFSKHQFFSVGIAQLFINIALINHRNDLCSLLLHETMAIYHKQLDQNHKNPPKFSNYLIDHNNPLFFIRMLAHTDRKLSSYFNPQTEKSLKSSKTLRDIMLNQTSKFTLEILKYEVDLLQRMKLPSVELTDLFFSYWILNSRLHPLMIKYSGIGANSNVKKERYQQLKALNPLNYDLNPLNEIDDSLLKQAYKELRSFATDKNRSILELKIPSGYKRYIYRNLCDDLHLRHKLAFSPKVSAKGIPESLLIITKSMTKVVITKDDETIDTQQVASLTQLPSYHDICYHNLRVRTKYHLPPLFWDSMRSYLLKISDEQFLQIISKLPGLLRAESNYSWAFLLIELCQERNIPVPRFIFKNCFKFNRVQSDLYGLVELVHLNVQEMTFGSSIPLYTEKLQLHKKLRFNYPLFNLPTAMEDSNDKFFSQDEFIENDHSLGTTPSNYPEKAENNNKLTYDIFDKNDWIDMINHAYRCRLHHNHFSSYHDTFTELIGLRKKYNLELDSVTIVNIIKFLVHKNTSSDLLKNMFNKIYNDKSFVISYDECSALSRFVARNLDSHKNLVPHPKIYSHSQGYFLPSSSDIDKILTLYIENFVKNDEQLDTFNSSWTRQHKTSGRKELYEIISKDLDMLNNNQATSSISTSEVRSVLLMVIHLSHLLATHDREHRLAYDLLYNAYLLYSRKVGIKPTTNQAI